MSLIINIIFVINAIWIKILAYTRVSYIVGRTKGSLAPRLPLRPMEMVKATFISSDKRHNEGRGTQNKMEASDIEVTSREGEDFIATGKSDVVFGWVPRSETQSRIKAQGG